MRELATVAQEQSGDTNNWAVYLLFIAAGLLVGGTWSAYQNGSKFLTGIMAVLAVLAFLGAALWLIGAMT